MNTGNIILKGTHPNLLERCNLNGTKLGIPCKSLLKEYGFSDVWNCLRRFEVINKGL
jgi:hypothetical protein